MYTFKQHKASDKLWKEESGMAIPNNRLTKYEKKAERELAKIARTAISLNAKLVEFKDHVQVTVRELYEQYMAENNGKLGKNKGNVSLYNFDRSVKVEVNVNEQITFDDLGIENVRAKLMAFIDDNINREKEFIVALVKSAFETSRGKLDVKKVLSLKKHASRIKSPQYQEAMHLLDKAIRRPRSKTYFRVWIRNAEGGYDDVQLNFSSI